MAKQQPATNPPLWEQIDQHPAVIWFTENGSNILYGLAAFVLILILMIRLGWIGSSNSGADYANAANQSNLFARSPDSETGQEALQTLQSLLKKHPELQAKYDGPIAQELLLIHDPEKAAPYLNRALKKTADKKLPLYAAFARTSLLISQENYTQALEQSLSLKKQLHANSDALYAFNLLRIASLQQKLKQREGETRTWEEWKDLAKTHPIYQKIEKIFVEGHIGLDNYIQRTK